LGENLMYVMQSKLIVREYYCRQRMVVCHEAFFLVLRLNMWAGIATS